MRISLFADALCPTLILRDAIVALPKHRQDKYAMPMFNAAKTPLAIFQGPTHSVTALYSTMLLSTQSMLYIRQRADLFLSGVIDSGQNFQLLHH